jgi:hypothetical protein
MTKKFYYPSYEDKILSKKSNEDINILKIEVLINKRHTIIIKEIKRNN